MPATLEPTQAFPAFDYRAITVYGVPFQETSSKQVKALEKATPHPPSISTGDSVCPIRLSIAFTNRIAVAFFSCRY